MSTKIFCLCHLKDRQYYNFFKQHLVSSEVRFQCSTIFDIEAGENKDEVILEKIQKANFIVYFASADSQADSNYYSLLKERSRLKYCEYFLIKVKPAKDIRFYEHARSISEKTLSQMSNHDMHKFWLDTINELEYWTYRKWGILKYNKRDFKEALPCFKRAKKIKFTNDIASYINGCNKFIFEEKTTQEIESKLNRRYESAYRPLKELTKELNLHKKMLSYMGIAILFFVITTVSYCKKSNKNTSVSITPALNSPLIVDNFYIKNSIPSEEREVTYEKKDIPYEKVRYLQPTVTMRVNGNKSQKMQFYWRIIDETNETIKSKRSPKNFTKKIELDVSPNRKNYPLGSIGNKTPVFDRGAYKNELWVQHNSNLILVSVDYFTIR